VQREMLEQHFRRIVAIVHFLDDFARRKAFGNVWIYR
jgi:hypothetical protein